MEVTIYEVIVSRRARAALIAIYRYLLLNVSEETADRVKNALMNLAESLREHPARYPKEAWIKLEGSDIRSTAVYNYKIIYEIKGTQVRILNFFHTKRNPADML